MKKMILFLVLVYFIYNCAEITKHEKNYHKIEVSPDTLKFNNTKIGSTDTLDITIKNEGSETLKISGIYAEGDFTTAGQEYPLTINTGSDSAKIEVYFEPQSDEAKEGKLIIISNDPDSPTIVDLKGTGKGALIAVEVPTFYAEIGDTNDTTIAIKNIGNDSLEISKIGFSESCFDDTLGNTSLSITSKNSIPILFSPITTGNQYATMYIHSNSYQDSIYTQEITGFGIKKTIIKWNSNGTDVELSDGDTLDFGTINLGSVTESIMFSNTTSIQIEASIITNDNNYFFLDDTLVTDNKILKITFKPNNPGSFSGEELKLVFKYGKHKYKTITLNLTGTKE